MLKISKRDPNQTKIFEKSRRSSTSANTRMKRNGLELDVNKDLTTIDGQSNPNCISLKDEDDEVDQERSGSKKSKISPAFSGEKKPKIEKFGNQGELSILCSISNCRI